MPHRAQDDEEQTRSTISESAVMFWPGVLAVASDLQLIPRLIGLDALKAAVEQVSVAPHRMKVDNEIVSVPPDGFSALHPLKTNSPGKCFHHRLTPTRLAASTFRACIRHL